MTTIRRPAPSWRPVDRFGVLPAYEQVARQIRAAIHSGALAPGAVLPSETELMAHCKVSRVTVRNAIKMLQLEGRIVTRQGLGSVVRDVVEETVLRRHGCSEEVACVAAGHVHDLVRARMPTQAERDRLRIGLGVPVLVIQQQEGSATPSEELVLAADQVSVQYLIRARS